MAKLLKKSALKAEKAAIEEKPVKNLPPSKKRKQKSATTETKRSPKAKRPTKAEELKIAARRTLVWDLYKAGASFRAIAEHLKAKGEQHCSVGTVHSDLKYCLSLQHNDLELDVKDHIENEVAIINDMQLVFYPIARDSKMPLDVRMDAADRVLNFVKERSRLRNLYKPPKVMLSPDDELAKILGISTNQLPDDEDSDQG